MTTPAEAVTSAGRAPGAPRPAALLAGLLVMTVGYSFMQASINPALPHLRKHYATSQQTITWVVTAFLLITLASIALPLMNGFIGEFLILIGAFRWDARLAVFAAIGVILSAVYMLWMFQRVNYGPLTNEKNRTLPDLSPREWAIVVPTVAMCIVMGVVPGVFLRPMEPSVARVIERVTGAQPARVERRPPPPPPGVRSDRTADSNQTATVRTSGANND